VVTGVNTAPIMARFKAELTNVARPAAMAVATVSLVMYSAPAVVAVDCREPQPIIVNSLFLPFTQAGQAESNHDDHHC
jgi:hypothetical protein